MDYFVHTRVGKRNHFFHAVGAAHPREAAERALRNAEIAITIVMSHTKVELHVYELGTETLFSLDAGLQERRAT